MSDAAFLVKTASLQTAPSYMTLVDLIRFYSTDPATNHVQSETSKLKLTIDAVLSCSLTINEFVFKALKYGFPADCSGTMQICFSAAATNHCRLVIADDGVGVPEITTFSQNASNLKTLWLQFVQAFVRQLQGTATLDRFCGSRFEILFPNPA